MRDAVRRLRDHDEEGLSLVEIMVATFILAVALLALASTATASLISLSTSLGRQMAMDAASAMIEDLRRTQFSAVALDEREGDVAAMPDCVDGEWVVKSIASGAMPRTQWFGEDDRVKVTTTITWYSGDAEADPCTVKTGDVKRVHVVAEWTDRGRSHTLEESTLVAAVDRGLPAPDFRVTPPDATVAFTGSDPANQTERCVPHVVRNLGAVDGYEWFAARIGPGTATKSGDIHYHDANGLIQMRAFFETPAGDEAVDPATFGLDWGYQNRQLPTGLDEAATFELMKDGTGDGNVWPEAETRLGPGDQARIWICYRVGTNASVGMTAQYKITVVSRFDPNRTESVEHTVTVDALAPKFYLFHDYEPDDPGAERESGDADSDRVRGTGGNQHLPTWLMGPIGFVEPTVLWPADLELPNYDTDFTQLAGLRLADGPRQDMAGDTNWAAGTVRFHHHHASATTTYQEKVTLTIWSAPESVLLGTLPPADGIPLGYQVRLEVLHHNESQVQQVLLDTEVDYPHTSSTWQAVTWDLFVPQDFTIQKDQFLRLQLECLSPPDLDACHIAFDYEPHDSNLQLRVR